MRPRRLRGAWFRRLLRHPARRRSGSILSPGTHTGWRTSLQKHSGMARVVEGFQSFTCTPMCLFLHRMYRICFCLLSRSWSSFADPGGMQGWVGLGTTMVSIKFAQDRYVTAVTVVSCSSCLASLGNWNAGERQTRDLWGRTACSWVTCAAISIFLKLNLKSTVYVFLSRLLFHVLIFPILL